VNRVLLRTLPALVATAATILIGWQVLKPAEVLDVATTPYVAAAEQAPHVTGRTNVAPLIVDGRIRVYAAKRQIRADTPVSAKSVLTARWSLRRWPEQLAGVVAIGTTVVSRWSDGQLVAVDARTGQIVWRVEGPAAPGYTGHRTGASMVWAPTGLHVAAGAVVVTAGQKLMAYDVSTGSQQWEVTVPAACTDGFTTTGGQYVCATGAYSTATGASLPSWPRGPHTPIACAVAASQCAAIRDGASRGWLVDGSAPRRVTRLDEPGSTYAAGLVVSADQTLREPSNGAVRGRLPAGQVLGVSHGRIVVLRADRDLVVFDPRTGATTAAFELSVDHERLTWRPGRWQVTDGYAAIERLTGDGPADADASNYYFTVDTVIIAAV
jgi:putative pyrroloquinoline-quinone binding quinoprotein